MLRLLFFFLLVFQFLHVINLILCLLIVTGIDTTQLFVCISQPYPHLESNYAFQVSQMPKVFEFFAKGQLICAVSFLIISFRTSQYVRKVFMNINHNLYFGILIIQW